MTGRAGLGTGEANDARAVESFCGLPYLESQDLGLNEVDRPSIDFDKTFSCLKKSTSTHILASFYPNQYSFFTPSS